jgi:hypothetical protein
MKLALRIAGVVGLALVAWWFFARSSVTPAITAVAPDAKERAAKNDDAPKDAPATAQQAQIEAPPTDDARAATPTPAPVAVAPQAPSAPKTLLRVRVVARETRKPLAGERVRVIPKGIENWSWSDIEGSHAAAREAPLTDAEGQAEIEVEPGHELTVHVGALESRQPLTTSALAAGETRELDIDIATEADRTLFGRLVDADTKQPIANGAVWCEGTPRGIEIGQDGSVSRPSAARRAPGDAIRSRGDGTFELRVRSWETKFANAKSDGYSVVVFAIDASHATADNALEVRLSRAATLEVVVLDGGRAAANAEVALTTESYHLQQGDSMLNFYFSGDPNWTAKTDANGRAEVGELPPRVPLKLSVHAGSTTRNEGEPLTLEPGEHRRVDIALGSGASIVGRIENSSGAPIAACEIWRLTAEVPMAKLLESYEKPVATARSDEQGRFHFDDVAAGTWLVGPKPSGSHWDRNSKTDTALAALAQPVAIDAGTHQVEVVLRVDIGLYLRGSVVDSAGAAVKQANVSAQSAGVWVYLNDNTDESGRFELGPLPSGSYTLEAENYQGSDAKSESVKATAGDADIVLRLRVGGAIHGRVVDAKGELRECELTLAREGEEFGFMMTASRDGKLAFDRLTAGTYAISAKTSDSLCGRRAGLVVRAGETLDNVEIVLEPGAHLKLRYDGAENYGQYQIQVAGIPCGGDGLERGKESLIVVPAGEIEVLWNSHDPKSKHSQKLTLRPGEERDVFWDGKP